MVSKKYLRQQLEIERARSGRDSNAPWAFAGVVLAAAIAAAVPIYNVARPATASVDCADQYTKYAAIEKSFPGAVLHVEPDVQTACDISSFITSIEPGRSSPVPQPTPSHS
jgi:hypothetical protein